jgi:hypothetical protein
MKKVEACSNCLKKYFRVERVIDDDGKFIGEYDQGPLRSCPCGWKLKYTIGGFQQTVDILKKAQLEMLTGLE